MKQLRPLIIAISILFASCDKKREEPVAEKKNLALAALEQKNYEEDGFPDFGYMVSPQEYREKIF
jgi:hypothetical protein